MLDETDITKDNQNIGRDKMREKVLLQESDDNSADTQQADVAYKHAGSVKCPQCGAENDAEADVLCIMRRTVAQSYMSQLRG